MLKVKNYYFILQRNHDDFLEKQIINDNPQMSSEVINDNIVIIEGQKVLY